MIPSGADGMTDTQDAAIGPSSAAAERAIRCWAGTPPVTRTYLLAKVSRILPARKFVAFVPFGAGGKPGFQVQAAPRPATFTGPARDRAAARGTGKRINIARGNATRKFPGGVGQNGLAQDPGPVI